MSDLVDPEVIEEIVGAKRDAVRHLARAVSDEEIVYILHSQECKDSGIDLRDCPYSRALDNGIDLRDWRDVQDRPVVIWIYHDQLQPLTPKWLDDSTRIETAHTCDGVAE